VDEVRWLVMQYKVSPTDVLWSPKDGLAIWLWKEDGTWQPILVARVLNPIPFCPIWRNDDLKAGETKRLLVVRFWNILNFGSLGCQRTIRILELWVLMWNIGRTFWNYYQDLSHSRVLFHWKAFGLLTIKELIMNAHLFLSL
jgi:hypothetical protein